MVDHQKPSKTVVTMVDHGHHFAWDIDRYKQICMASKVVNKIKKYWSHPEKPCFRVSNHVRHKTVSSATETSSDIEVSGKENRGPIAM